MLVDRESRPRVTHHGLLTALALAALLGTGSSAKAGDRLSAWQDTKCRRYAAAWDEALRRFGTAGLAQDFLDQHRAFLASGCRIGRTVCPRSGAEITLANALTVAAMNSGTSSTFLPFVCRD